MFPLAACGDWRPSTGTPLTSCRREMGGAKGDLEPLGYRIEKGAGGLSSTTAAAAFMSVTY